MTTRQKRAVGAGIDPTGQPDPPKLMGLLRDTLRSRHHSPRTEEAYCLWVKRYVCFHKLRHPADMGAAEINAFLTHLAIDSKVSASTQNQALCALLFLCRRVFGYDVGNVGDVVRARKSHRVPIVMTREQARSVLSQMSGDTKLMASCSSAQACGSRSA